MHHMVNHYFFKKSIKNVSNFHQLIDRDKIVYYSEMSLDSILNFVLIIESSYREVF